MTDLSDLIEAQDALIAALDTADPAQIDAASAHMARVTEAIKSDGVRLENRGRADIETARGRNIEAAKRVNSLTSWTKSKLERINELRGGTPGARSNTY